MNNTSSHFRVTWVVTILVLFAIVILLKPTMLDHYFPLSTNQGVVDNSVTSVPTIGQATQHTVADTGVLLMEQTVSIAERNIAWASYVLTAVGVLFTLVVLATTFWNESRYLHIHNEWVQLRNLVQSDTDIAVNKVNRELSQICSPMADFMVRTALYEKMYPRDNHHSAHNDDYLGRTAHAGVKLLVLYAETYQEKQMAVRRLSRIVDYSTLDCLNEIESNIVPRLEACRERDDLLDVINTTRDVIRSAINAANTN